MYSNSTTTTRMGTERIQQVVCHDTSCYCVCVCVCVCVVIAAAVLVMVTKPHIEEAFAYLY